jgi:hypothetical protein
MEIKSFSFNGMEFPVGTIEIKEDLIVWEYYYRIGNRHYFRNQYGSKISFVGVFNLKRGYKCHIDIKPNNPISKEELKQMTVIAESNTI